MSKQKPQKKRCYMTRVRTEVRTDKNGTIPTQAIYPPDASKNTWGVFLPRPGVSVYIIECIFLDALCNCFKHLTRQELLNRMRLAMSGRVVKVIFFDTASRDIAYTKAGQANGALFGCCQARNVKFVVLPL